MRFFATLRMIYEYQANNRWGNITAAVLFAAQTFGLVVGSDNRL
jgi:hypothetical protein